MGITSVCGNVHCRRNTWFPGSPLTLAVGALFGFARGSVIDCFAATSGATAAQIFARTLGRDPIWKRLRRLAGTLDRLKGDSAFLTLLRLRLVPVELRD
jgi:uncharacterized membrane protein YdjX (TVP38/TMEM64 family)